MLIYKEFSSRQSFLSSCLQNRAVCEASTFLSMEAKNVIANSNMTVFLSQVSLTDTEELKNTEIICSCSELFDVIWQFPVYVPQIPVNWPAVTIGNFLISCFCPWNCVWVEDKPLREVWKAMMFVDHAVGNSAAKIKSLYLYQVLDWVCVYLQQTQTDCSHNLKVHDKLFFFLTDKSLTSCH